MDEPKKSDCKNVCFICDKLGSSSASSTNLGEIIKITRGLPTLRNVSVEREDGLLHFLNSVQFIYAHSVCRQKYIHRKYIKTFKNKDNKVSIYSPPRKRLRSVISTGFNWKENCLFCGTEADEMKERQKKKALRKKIHRVINSDFKKTILNFVVEKKVDSYREVYKRVTGVIDLVAVEAKYHRDCYISFRDTYKALHKEQKIHSQVSHVDAAMDEIYKYIEENDDCQFSLQELKNILTTPYIPDDKTIKSRLLSHYKDNILLSSKFGSNTIICFRKKHHEILSKNWYTERLDNDAEEEYRILRAAGEILRRHIRSEVYSNDSYSASDKMFESVNTLIPKSLNLFLSEIILTDKKSQPDNLVFYERKCASIAHAIISAVRPRSFISPLHVALSVTLHRKFGSKKIIDICNALGFCGSYKEATLYEASAAFANPVKIKKDSFVQFVHDNADFNVNTLDGKGTFHNLGSIQIVTPSDVLEPREAIKRLEKIPSESQMAEKGNIPIEIYCKSPGEGLQTLSVKISQPVPSLKPTINSKLNTLWMYLKFKTNNDFPGWNGFMNMLTSAHDFDTSSIIFLPFINASPSDYNTLYTALKTSVENARSSNMRTCIVTFDQPLHIKAVDIVAALGLSEEILVVIRTGAFHTLMSFMGSIGYIMGGSGIKEALASMYAENTVEHILSGRAYARAVRAHILLQQALSRLIFSDLKENNKEFAAFIDDENTSNIFNMFNYTEIVKNDGFKRIAEIFENKLLELQNKNKTSKLWVSYFQMVSILKDFIAAERMGDWDLHLHTTELMIPYFHSSGHFPYAKSAQIYLQQMKELETKMDPIEFKKFTGGYFTCRRTNQFFTGISSDQTIEQTLMKAMSVEGGPFKRGVTESIVYKWIKGVIFTKDIIEGIEDFCNVSFKKGYQHADSTDARIQRDNIDVQKLEGFFLQHNPFPDVDAIMSIANGITGDDTINCYDAFNKGLETMKKLDGKNFKELKLTKKDKVVPLMAINNKIKVNNELVPIDPLLLFHRICVCKKSEEDLKTYMTFELAPYPVALFNDGEMRKTKKATFYDLFSELSINVNDIDKFIYVVDGGMLLHRCKWQLEEKFGAICENYVRYLRNNYGRNVYVVFDGYNKAGTKSVERQRRLQKNASADFIFDEDMPLKIGQEKFLGNSKNKTRLINMLRKKLSDNKIFSCQAEADADTLIIETAINIDSKHVVVVSEDIDVLVLLTALTPNDRTIYFRKPAKGKAMQKVFSSKSLESTLPMCKKHILFLHAFTGCDTTSAFYNRGKNKFATTFEKRKDLQDAAEVFVNVNENLNNICEAGVKCVLALYDPPKKIQDLNSLRYNSFIKATTKSSCVQLATLVPTPDAVFEHLKRVYLQVQLWLGIDISPTDWGWKYDREMLRPIRMNQPAAPECLLKIIFCTCKTGCGAACGCRKHGLSCTAACSECNGESCFNPSPIIQVDEMENEDIEHK